MCVYIYNLDAFTYSTWVYKNIHTYISHMPSYIYSYRYTQLACFANWAAIAAPSKARRVPRQNEENRPGRPGHWMHRRNTMDVENVCKTSTESTLLIST